MEALIELKASIVGFKGLKAAQAIRYILVITSFRGDFPPLITSSRRDLSIDSLIRKLSLINWPREDSPFLTKARNHPFLHWKANKVRRKIIL